MRPTALLFVVCQGLADQGPLDVNGFPVDGIKLNEGTCRNEIVQMYDPDNMGPGAPTPNFAYPLCVLARQPVGDAALGVRASGLVREAREMPAS